MISKFRALLKNKPYLSEFTLLAAYAVVYLIWFRLLETGIEPEYIVSSSLDAYIPFSSVFVIPYLLWFPFVCAAILYFLFSKHEKAHEEFMRLCAFLFIGMTVCLLIYTFFPNGQNLRPATVPGDGICDLLVAFIYSLDTPTNVFPSIHVFNSIAVAIAVCVSPLFEGKGLIKTGVVAVATLICASTLLIKQHTVDDLIAGTILALVMYVIIYRLRWRPTARVGARESGEVSTSVDRPFR